MEQRYLTILQAAHYLGITPVAVRQRVKRRYLPFIRDGHRIMFDRFDLDRYMRSGRVSTKREVKVKLHEPTATQT